MDTVRIDVANARQVALRFDEFPNELYADLRAEIDKLAVELFARVQAATPDATGKLRSQERVRVFADPKRITGYVDIGTDGSRNDAVKAAALEYGSKGKPAKISAHSMQLDHVWSNRLNAPMTVMVKQYDRTPNIAERAFERGPLAQMQPEVASRLNAVVERAVAAANK
jgi:hypothetical protein